MAEPRNTYAYQQILGALHRRGASVAKTDLSISGRFEDPLTARIAVRALSEKYGYGKDCDFALYGVWPSVSDDGQTLTFDFDPVVWKSQEGDFVVYPIGEWE